MLWATDVYAVTRLATKIVRPARSIDGPRYCKMKM